VQRFEPGDAGTIGAGIVGSRVVPHPIGIAAGVCGRRLAA
jgi:hypothetical protein